MFQIIVSIIENTGYLGIFLLMIAENIFPPIPSEVIIPLAGFAAAKGELNILGVVFATTLGSLVGTTFWYVIGRSFGTTRLKRLSFSFGRVLTLTADDVDRAQAWFLRHGYLAVFFGRLVPTVRSLISVPAGIAKMPLRQFLLFSFVGTLIWNSFLLFFGYVLESQYATMSSYIDFVSNFIIIAFISIYIYRVITFKNIDTKEV
jgi:membrane protein DedA with SNARE-associated domain